VVGTVADALDLDAITARANAAAPGPWARYETFHADTFVVDPRGFLREGIVCGATYERDNAEFIAHAREDVPALVAEVRRLREEAVFLHVNAWSDAAKIAAAAVGAGSVALLPEILAQCAAEARLQEPSLILSTTREEMARGPRS
jgi:hypothetical protein